MKLASAIARVISGGQTGADVAGIRAAKAAGLPTGGTMPRGWRTLVGPRPEYQHLYGMTEHASASWGPRTFVNVHNADITLRIALNLDSAGERLTLRACEQMGKSRADIQLDLRCLVPHIEAGTFRVALWAIDGAAEAVLNTSRTLDRPVVVNVAGNSERTAPGIERAAFEVMRRILVKVGEAS